MATGASVPYAGRAASMTVGGRTISSGASIDAAGSTNGSSAAESVPGEIGIAKWSTVRAATTVSGGNTTSSGTERTGSDSGVTTAAGAPEAIGAANGSPVSAATCTSGSATLSSGARSCVSGRLAPDRETSVDTSGARRIGADTVWRLRKSFRRSRMRSDPIWLSDGRPAR